MVLKKHLLRKSTSYTKFRAVSPYMLLKSNLIMLLHPFHNDGCHSFGAIPIIPLCLYDDGNCGETCHNHYDIAFICCATLLQFMHPLKNFFVLLHFHIHKILDKELSFLHGELMLSLQHGSDRYWASGHEVAANALYVSAGHVIDSGHKKSAL